MAIFDEDLSSNQFDAEEGRITSMTLPSGEVTTFHYRTTTYLSTLRVRLQSVTNTFGYQLHWEYARNTTPTTGAQMNDWWRVTKATGINNAVVYCNPTADSCGLSGWPTVTYAPITGGEFVTDTLGRTTNILTQATLGVTAIAPPSGDGMSITYDNGRVDIVLRGATNQWQYDYVDTDGPDADTDPDTRTTTVTDPLSHTREVISEIAAALVTSDEDGVGRVTNYEYDTEGRLTEVTRPDGTQTLLTYDSRGNITQRTERAVSSSGLADITVTAAYDSTCSNPVTCNLPNVTTDARGFEAEYTYSASHGGILTVTAPGPTGSAPDGTGTRPQTRYSYTSLYAYYRNSSGTIVAAPTPVTLLEQVSACATTSSCANGADETRTTIGYGGNGVANNRLPLTVTTAAGDGAVTQTVTSTYDDVGNLLTIDGPLTDDTVRNRYDAGRQLIGVVGPDPDGGGSLKHRAIRYTYSNTGQVTSIEQGTVDSQSDPHWASFTSLQQQTIAYSADYQPTHQRLVAGGVTYALTQTTYDAALRPECVAGRMNPATFAAPPASACTLATEGAAGPDRIVRNTYTNADQVATVTTGYSAGSPITVQQMTYGDNYQLASLTDAGGNVALYEYDDFGRLQRLRFPDADGSGTSDTDYLGYTYDVFGRLTQTRLRDATTVAHTYDNLGRLVENDVSDGSSLDASMEYDLFSRLIEVAENSRTLENTYDQLSRLVTATSPLGNVGYQYDAASRLTRITWPDTFYAQYDYDLTGAVTAIRENGASSGAGVLATYAYDNLGRRTGVTRGNGASEAAVFDGASRLTSLTQNLSGTGDDVTFAFTYDAAFNIVTRDVTSTNAAYAWSPSGSGTSYADNGLNQYTTIGGVSQSYDDNGNLETGGYVYDVLSRLIDAPGMDSLAYDPAGRLYETVVSGTTTRFLYSGAELIGEYNGSNVLQRRYVPGPGLDEPVTWYEGSGTSDRRWLLSDERGSVIGYATGAGAGAMIGAYDEYGAPASWTGPRFRYAGAMSLPEAQLYHMRARAYAPGIGRFIQADPILHAGGMNLYRYVGNDPMNRFDPWGLTDICLPGEECVDVTGRRNRPEPTNVNDTFFDLYGTTSDILNGPNSGFVDGNYYDEIDVEAVVVTATRGPPPAPSRTRQDHCLLFDADCDGFRTDEEWRALAGSQAIEDATLDFVPVPALRGLNLARLLCRGCFAEGTLVATPEGLRPIEEIEVGDQVFAWNPETGETTTETVTALVRPAPQATYALVLLDAGGERETFVSSADHPWFVVGRGWVETVQLQPGDRIVSARGADLVVRSVTSTARTEQTYNLNVSGPHTFLVGEDGAVVHNCRKARLLATTIFTRPGARPVERATGIVPTPTNPALRNARGEIGPPDRMMPSEGRNETRVRGLLELWDLWFGG